MAEMGSAIQELDPAALSGVVAGTVVSPADEAWDKARAAWNLAADQRPRSGRAASAGAADGAEAATRPSADHPGRVLRHGGGALASAPTGAGARSHLDGEYVFLGIGMAMSPELAGAVNRHIDAVCTALAPWSAGRCYFAFADRPTDLDRLFDPATLTRLRSVKEHYEPGGLVCGNHNIAAA